MEGIINMSEGDNTNPWDMFKTGWESLTAGNKKPPSVSPSSQATGMGNATSIQSYRPNQTPYPHQNRMPTYKNKVVNLIHNSAMKNLPYIAANPYKNNPFYANNNVIDNWYRKIHNEARQKAQASTGSDRWQTRNGLEGSIAGEPYTHRAYNTAEPNITPELTNNQTAPQKQGLFDTIQHHFDPVRLKQAEETITRFMNSGQTRPVSQNRITSINTNTINNGDQHGNRPDNQHPYPRIHVPSGVPPQKTATLSNTGEYPLIQSETVQAAQAGKDMLDVIKPILPDLGVGIVVAGGKIVKDAAGLAATITGSDTLRDISQHIENTSEKFIQNSGSEKLNRQLNAINKTMNDPAASGSDLAKTLIENPYGSIFNAGTEMAGIALPTGAAKSGQIALKVASNMAPRLVKTGTKVLPYLPHGIQTVQSAGDSLNRSKGEPFAQRAMKALGASAITGAGSLASGGGIAGETGKRLANQITKGTLKTATGTGAAIGKQAILNASQNIAGHTSDTLAEGKLPSANELGKQAVKGAVDGTIAGASLHHAVVPTERRSRRMIEAAGNGNRNAHTLEKHGKQTSNEQQRLRANTGISPDGKRGFKTDSSRWLRNVDTADGMAAAKKRWEEEIRLNSAFKSKRKSIEIDFDNPIGEGYLKGTRNLIKTNKATFKFDNNGNLITSYPYLKN